MVDSEAGIAGIIEDYVRKRFHIMDGDSNFTRGANLYDNGFVDSVGALELISFVESTFNVKLDDEHIFSEAFTTINGISGVVASCLSEKSMGSAPEKWDSGCASGNPPASALRERF